MLNNHIENKIVQLLKWDKTKEKNIEVLIRITSNCNLRCRFCFAKDEFGNPTPAKIAEYIINKLSRKGIKNKSNISFNITGGEPLVRRDFFDVLQILKRGFGDYSVNIQTNAILVDDEIAKKLSKYNVVSAFVSLPALNSKTYYRLTGSRDGFFRALKGIKRLKEAGIEVCLNFVLTKLSLSNFLEIPTFVFKQFGKTVSVNLSTLSPGTPELFLIKYGVSYPIAGKLFKEIYNGLISKEIKYSPLGGDCFPPICAFDDKNLAKNFSFSSTDLPIRYVTNYSGAEDGYRYKSMECKRCSYDSKCIGVSAIYARIFKENNFSAL